MNPNKEHVPPAGTHGVGVIPVMRHSGAVVVTLRLRRSIRSVQHPTALEPNSCQTRKSHGHRLAPQTVFQSLSSDRPSAAMKAGPTPGSNVPPPSPLSTVAAPPPKKSSWYQKLGQSFNAPGIKRFGQLSMGDGSMALPHLSVPNISHVDWRALRRAGFQGCVFDKDNTLTEPYAIAVAPILADSLKNCLEAFGGRVVLLSNSAGLEEFDPEGEEANKLEKLLGVTVLRHKYKKPEGGPEELEAHFGCKAEELIMIGDRYLTDVVYGNKNGLFTIRPAPLTLEGEPKMVRWVRGVEDRFVHRRISKGKQAPKHPLIPDNDMLASFVKAPEAPTL